MLGGAVAVRLGVLRFAVLRFAVRDRERARNVARRLVRRPRARTAARGERSDRDALAEQAAALVVGALRERQALMAAGLADARLRDQPRAAAALVGLRRAAPRSRSRRARDRSPDARRRAARSRNRRASPPHSSPPCGPGRSPRAITSSRIPPRGHAGTSILPLGVSIASRSPGRDARATRRHRVLISAHDCQVIFVIGSGVSWSSGRFAPRPSPSIGDGTASSTKPPSPASSGSLNWMPREAFGESRDRGQPRRLEHAAARERGAPVRVLPGRLDRAAEAARRQVAPRPRRRSRARCRAACRRTRACRRADAASAARCCARPGAARRRPSSRRRCGRAARGARAPTSRRASRPSRRRASPCRAPRANPLAAGSE